MGKHDSTEYGSGGSDELKRKALAERQNQGGYSAGNTDNSRRGRGNEAGQGSDRSERD